MVVMMMIYIQFRIQSRAQSKIVVEAFWKKKQYGDNNIYLLHLSEKLQIFYGNSSK